MKLSILWYNKVESDTKAMIPVFIVITLFNLS